MSRTAASTTPVFVTVADVLSSMQEVPAERLRVHPAPGTATEEDLLRVNEDAFRTAICELVDGTLVEKTMSSYESMLAVLIITKLYAHVLANDLGIVLGADGMLRLAPGLVRVPDVSFISWEQLPDKRLPDEPIWTLHPDLAVEVLSPSDTPGEMQRKLQHYFESGAKLVWHLDPQQQHMREYRSETEFEVIERDGTVSGGDVLPGFKLSMAELFKLAPPAAE